MITLEQWILDKVQGYKLELTENPIQANCPRVGVASTYEQSLIEEEIQSMLQKGGITELILAEAMKGIFSNLFLLLKKDGGMRPVFILKHLNEFVPSHDFKMEGIHTL